MLYGGSSPNTRAMPPGLPQAFHRPFVIPPRVAHTLFPGPSSPLPASTLPPQAYMTFEWNALPSTTSCANDAEDAQHGEHGQHPRPVRKNGSKGRSRGRHLNQRGEPRPIRPCPGSSTEEAEGGDYIAVARPVPIIASSGDRTHRRSRRGPRYLPALIAMSLVCTPTCPPGRHHHSDRLTERAGSRSLHPRYIYGNQRAPFQLAKAFQGHSQCCAL